MGQLLLAVGIGCAYSGITDVSKNNRMVNQGVRLERPTERPLSHKVINIVQGEKFCVIKEFYLILTERCWIRMS